MARQFDSQIEAFSAKTGVPVVIVSRHDDATINVVVGDTFELIGKKSGEIPIDAWWANANDRTRLPVAKRELNLGLHGQWATNWLEGLYREDSGDLVYGQIRVHWNGVAYRTTNSGQTCSLNFVEHVVYLYTLGVTFRFRDDLRRISAAARERANVDVFRDINAANDIENLILGALFCVDAARTTIGSSLNLCSRQVAELIASGSR